MTTVKVPTSELSGEALGWAVAQATGRPIIIESHTENLVDCNDKPYARTVYEVKHSPDGVKWERYLPWALWDHCRPFMESGSVDVLCGHWGENESWICEAVATPRDGTLGEATGREEKIAICRAIVDALLGGMVDVPTELLPLHEDKVVEEMIDVMSKGRGWHHSVMSNLAAHRMYKAGYRKQPQCRCHAGEEG